MDTLDNSINQLQTSSYWNERREAALSLGHSKKPEACSALIEALDDPDDDVLQAVIVALGSVGDERAVEKMLLPRYLHHSDPHIRWATLQAIEKIGNFFVVTEVADLLNDDEWIVRNEAQRVLRKQVEFVVRHCSLESAQRMVGLLNSANEELRAILIDAFVQMCDEIKPLIHDFAKTGGKRIQTAMANVLGRKRDKDALPLLIGLLKDHDKYIRKAAVEALGELADGSSVQALIETFGDSSPEVQEAAVAAVARIGKPAVDALHEALRFSSRKSIQRNVLYTLAEIGDPASIPYFLDCLGNTYFIVRRGAIEGLVKYGEEGIRALPEVIRNVELPMVDDLLKQAENGTTTLIRIRAIRALGALADHRAVHLLKRLAASRIPAIQEASLDALAQIGCACWQRCGALAVLRELRMAPDVGLIVEQLDDDSENVRLRSVQVLSRGGNPEAVPALIQTAAIDGNAGIRYEALRAADELAPADPTVVEAALRALDDPSPRVQAEAARIIGRSPVDKNLMPLVECLKNSSWEVRRNASLALGNMGEKALPSLMKRLEEGDETEVESAIRAIGNVGDPSATSAIRDTAARFSEDSPVRYAAEKAIADLHEEKK